MSSWQQFLLGIKTYKKANTFVFQNGLWIYFLYPIIISSILIYLSISATEGTVNTLEEYIQKIVSVDTNITWVQYILDGFNYLIGIGIKIVFSVIGFIISSYATLIIMSPIMALLSERTEEIVTGEKFPFKIGQFLKDILRGVYIAIRNIFIEFWFILICFIFSAIPLIGLTSPIFLLIVSFYFYGFSLIDYTSERHQLNIRQSVAFMNKNKGLAIGNGMIFSILLKIPLIGIIFAPVLGPVAATIAVLELKGYSTIKIIRD